MEIVMSRIDKHAGYYRGFLADDRSLIPLTIMLGVGVGLWLLVYLIGAVENPYKTQMSILQQTPASVTHQHGPEGGSRP